VQILHARFLQWAVQAASRHTLLAIGRLFSQLKVEQAFRLVYIFTNLRLLDKDSGDYFHERFQAWRARRGAGE